MSEDDRLAPALIAARAGHGVFVAEHSCARTGATVPAVLGWIHVARGIWLESGERAEFLGLVVGAAASRTAVDGNVVAAAKQYSRAAALAGIVVRSNALRTETHSFYLALEYGFAKTAQVYIKTPMG